MLNLTRFPFQYLNLFPEVLQSFCELRTCVVVYRLYMLENLETFRQVGLTVRELCFLDRPFTSREGEQRERERGRQAEFPSVLSASRAIGGQDVRSRKSESCGVASRRGDERRGDEARGAEEESSRDETSRGRKRSEGDRRKAGKAEED